ncbi:MAG TPA: potassium-transporting ATPase subunit KdpC [Beijerinckiaceae bacterium]|nr:potassium-transporting ATPase subunit KdpC [Beijerinckiaceae bacterium]
MLAQLRPAIVMIVLFSALTGLVYPLAITEIAQVALSKPADGSLITKDDGTIIGSSLIGQSFASDKYFHGRPSATSAPDPNDATKTVDAPYNAANSSGSNLGPTSQKLLDRVKGDVAGLGGSPSKPVPADAVTTSASGLDPDISPDYARLQASRVAAARNLPVDRVAALVESHIKTPVLGIFGEPRVNVLRLNMDLDRLGA